jgi:hypothetical protein
MFWPLIAIVVVLDVIVVQPFYVLVVYLWRWLLNDSEDDETGDLLSIVHELHPIHGQWRYEGPLFDMDDLRFVAGDDE